MNLNYQQEKDYSHRELNYQYLNQPYSIKRDRFHYKSHPKNNFIHEVVVGKNHNQNIYDNDVEIRRINDNSNEFNFENKINSNYENKHQRNYNYNKHYKYNSVDMKNENVNNNNYKNYKMYYNYNVSSDFDINQENEINSKSNYIISKTTDRNNNRNENELYKYKYSNSQNLNFKEGKEKYNINNDKHQFNINKKSDENYLKEIQMNKMKNNAQSNKVIEQRQDIRNVVLKEVDNKYINSPKKSHHNIQKSLNYQVINYDKNEHKNYNNKNIEFNYQNDMNNLRYIQNNDNDQQNKKPKSTLNNHSFKYINQSYEKYEKQNKPTYNDNYKYNKNKIISNQNLNNSNKKNFAFEKKYVNEKVEKPQPKNNIKANNQTNNIIYENRINFESNNYDYNKNNYKPIFKQDDQVNKANNKKYRDNSAIIGKKFNNKRNTVNINISNNYKDFLKKEVGKNIRNSMINICEIKNSRNIDNEFKEIYNNISYKIIKNEDINENDKKYAVKAKVVKKNDNKNDDFKVIKDHKINEYNPNNINKHISYNNIKKPLDENQQSNKEELLKKYSTKREYKRPGSENKYQQNQNINYHKELYKKEENKYDYKRNNPPVKNVLKENNSKEIRKSQITINYNLNEYKNNKVYQEPLESKYLKEFEVINEKQKDYNTIEINDPESKQMNQNSSRNQNSYIENKTRNIMKNYGYKVNFPYNNSSELIIDQKSLDMKKKPIKNNNVQYKYVNEVKENKNTNKISPVKEKQKNENKSTNNLIKENNNNKTNLNSQAFNKNNINNNNQLNKNNIGRNNFNNQINNQKRVLSPEPVQNVKIRSQMLNNIGQNNNQKKFNENLINNNYNINNNKNYFSNNNNDYNNKNMNNNSNNINKINYNINYNYNFTNNNINQKNDFNNNINNNNANLFKNNIKEVAAIKNNNSMMNKFQNNNNDSYNMYMNNNIDIHNRNLSPSLPYNNFNIRLSKNIIVPKQLNFEEQNQLMKNNSSPNLRVRNKVDIKKKFANGLQNIGANCYMNPTLQCLAHVENLTRHLLERKNEIQLKKYSDKLTYSYLELLENLWKNNAIKDYAPYNFKEIITKMNPLFRGVQTNDSKELIIFLLENMHHELNKAKNVNKYDENSDKYNFYNCLNNFNKYFKNNNQSIISDIFYGINNLQKKCLNCELITHNIQFYNILNIPLEEVLLFKKYQQNTVTIKDCFEYNQRIQHVIGQNKIFCNRCKQTEDSVTFNSLITGPKVLIINLNRGKGFQFDVNLNFDEYIDINEFIYFKNTPNRYQLIGVMTHIGQPGKNGHFIAICKSFVDGNWYKYDDSLVTLSNFQEAKTIGIPCVLFYSAFAN